MDTYMKAVPCANQNMWHRLPRRLGCAILAAVMLGSTLLIGGCGASEADVPALVAPASVQTESAVVVRGGIARVAVYDAAVVARTEELHFDEALNGYSVRRFERAEGEAVKSGDAMIRLDIEPLERELADLEAQVAEIQREANEAEVGYRAEIVKGTAAVNAARKESLRAIALANAALEKQKLAQNQARAGRNAEKARLETRMQEIRVLMEKAVLRAPKDGVVAGLYVEIGDAAKHRQVAAVLVDGNALCIEVAKSQTLRSNAAHSYNAVIGETVYPLAVEESETQQVVQALGVKVKPARLVFTGAVPEGLQAGQFIYVHATEASAADTLLVPRNAVFETNGGAYVYRMMADESGEAALVKTMVPVVVGVTNDSDAEILDGLEEGDVVFVK